MNELAEWIEDTWERMRRRPRAHRMLRGAMLAFGVLAQVWITLAGSGGLLVVGIVAVVLAVIVVQSVMPLLTAGLFVAQAAALDLSVPAMVPLAAALIGWHVCATILSLGRPWSRLGGAVIRGFRVPIAVGLIAIGVGAVAAGAVAGIAPADAPIVTLVAVLAVLLGGTVALWPTPRKR